MRILIWKSFGEVDVLCAESVEHIECIAHDVLDAVEHWNVDAVYDLRAKTLAIMKLHGQQSDETTRRLLVQCVKSFVDDHCRGDDSFEGFTFTRVKYKVTS